MSPLRASFWSTSHLSFGESPHVLTTPLDMTFRIGLALLVMTLFMACHQPPAIWDGPTLTQPRTQLTASALLQSASQPLMDLSFFARPPWAEEALTPLEGHLKLAETLLTFPKEKAFYPGENLFPALSLSFVTHEGQLIPLQKSRISTRDSSQSYWDVIVGTGRVWYESGDSFWSRASFPLTLTDRWVGQARNCVATFVYSADSMSAVCLQCSQETADIDDQQLGNISAMIPAQYAARSLPHRAEAIAHHQRAFAERLPLKPLQAIDVDGAVAAYLERPQVSAAPTSMGALWLDGTLYLHPPQTRHGVYPYPLEMRHGLYSVTKSMAGALALMYLEERYNGGVFEAKITDYVPALAQHPGWQGVTFGQTLDMATGVDGGEDAARLFGTLIVAETAEEAIQNIATLADDPHTPPGTRFHYATTNLFVLSYAMQRYVAQREGVGVRYWDLVRQEVLTPIGAPQFEVLHTQETDPAQALPILGFGALPTIDEAAKIALLFANGGAHEGRQLLRAQRVQAAFGQVAGAGYDTHQDVRGDWYGHSFWAKTMRVRGCEVRATYMLGFGENYVVFLPSGAIVFRFYDEHDLNIDGLLRAVEALAPSCQ